LIAAVLAPLLWESLISLALGAAVLFLCAGAGVLLALRLSNKKPSTA
jgi:DHA1 family bicyclomycin/chloramphenicol resistance-like MFS transporter